MINKRIGKVIFYVGGTLLLLIVVLILSCAASYSIYNTDDYSMALGYYEAYGSSSNHIIASLILTVKHWFSWGGTYTAIFLIELLNPLLGYGLSQMSAVMTSVVIILLFSTFFFVFSFFYSRGLDRDSCFFIAICFIWIFFNYKTWPEAIFWFTGAMDYPVPLSLLVVSFVLLEKWVNSEKRILLVFTYILAIIASGGSQAIAIAAFVEFFLFFVRYWFTHRDKIKNTLILASITVIPFLNLLAPGNFARQSGIGDTYLLKSIFFAVRIFIVESERLFKDTGFILVLLVIGGTVYCNEKKGISISLFDIVSLWITSIAVSFLACLGYESAFLPNRTLFVIDFFIVVGYLSLAVMLGIVLRQYNYENCNIKKSMVYLSLICLIVATLLPYRIEDGYIYKLGKSLVKGEIQGYYNKVCDILDEIESETSNIVYLYGLPKAIDGFVELWLSADENDYKYLGNLEMAAYYGKDKIIVCDDSYEETN